MNPKIKKFVFHGGAPAWLDSPRRPAYRISGTGFGELLGRVDITRAGELTSRPIVSWSDSVIYIDAATPLGGCAEVTVTRHDGQRSRPFEYARPRRLIVPPLDRVEGFRLAA